MNSAFRRLYLKGLEDRFLYHTIEDEVDTGSFYGSELMNMGLITTDMSAGELPHDAQPCGDFWSRIVVLEADA